MKISKNKFLGMLVFLLISSISISGQYKDALISRMSNFRNSVFANVDEGNDFQQKEALRKTEEEWDKELNIVYQKIMKVSDPVTKNKLRNAQRAWIKFRDSEVEKSYYTNNANGGSMGILFSLNTATKLTEERAVQLAEMYDALDK
ncbi:lysozyme inhibitor LprI family protein [Leptotrichia massiliensis]|uniref:lysozyme inhibitor LprI family protein n=1 Tax=Leptotrichia massiliensis TaxID=1852388 RepID=UPI0028EED3E1|nr:lysozyme inhibitor LprI family protein [Leptotrichia massiliensis]